MASDFQVLNDWLDVDISFHTYFSVSSFNRIQAVTEIEQRHTIFFGVKYCEKNDKKINKFVRNAFVHAAQTVRYHPYLLGSFNVSNVWNDCVCICSKKYDFPVPLFRKLFIAFNGVPSVDGWKYLVRMMSVVHFMHGGELIIFFSASILNRNVYLRVCISIQLTLFCASFTVHILFHFISVFPTGTHGIGHTSPSFI